MAERWVQPLGRRLPCSLVTIEAALRSARSACILQGLSIWQEQLVSSHMQLSAVGEGQSINVLTVQPVSKCVLLSSGGTDEIIGRISLSFCLCVISGTAHEGTAHDRAWMIFIGPGKMLIGGPYSLYGHAGLPECQAPWAWLALGHGKFVQQ